MESVLPVGSLPGDVTAAISTGLVRVARCHIRGHSRETGAGLRPELTQRTCREATVFAALHPGEVAKAA